MGTGEGGELEVDPEMLAQLGTLLQESADRLPRPPESFNVVGADAISAAIKEKLPNIEDGILTGLPEVKTQASGSASNVVSAAAKYQDTDQQSAAEIGKAQLGSAASGSGGSSAAGAGGMGQMSQLMSMPMQMAGQAMQMPMQAMGTLASVPQGIMQGVQQVSQMAGGLGGSEGGAGGKPGEPTEDRAEKDERRDDDEAERDARQGATPGVPNAERAPDSASKDAPAPVPQQSSPRHAAPDPTVNL